MKNLYLTRAAAAVLLALSAGFSQALTVGLSMDATSPLTVGSQVTFTVSDQRPRDMFDAGLGVAAGDFVFQYNMAALDFVSVAYPSWITSATNTFAFDNSGGPPAGEVLVTLSGLDELELPDALEQLFQVTFTVKTAGQVTLSPSLPASYAFASQRLGFDVTRTVPVPATGLLLALGLLAAAGVSGVAHRRTTAACPSSC